MFLVWLILIIVYIVFGVTAALVTYKKIKSGDERPLITSFVIAIFFSFGLADGRLPVPVPILPLLFFWIYDVIFSFSSIKDGIFFILIPFLVQWVLIAGVFYTICNIREKFNRGQRLD